MTITREQALEEAMRLFNPSGHVFTETVPPKPKPKPKDGRDAANAAAAVEKLGKLSRERIERLENARGWAAYFGGQALAHHDAAARAAEQRDRALALVEQLETDGGTAV